MPAYPWFPLFAFDWLASNNRAIFTLEQRGIFFELLCRQWTSPDCCLPADQATLAAFAGAAWNATSTVVERSFPPHPTLAGKVANPKLLSIWQDRENARVMNSEAGRKSAQVRQSRKKSTEGQRKVNARSTTVPTEGQRSFNDRTNGTPTEGQRSGNYPDPDPDKKNSANARACAREAPTAVDWNEAKEAANRALVALSMSVPSRAADRSLVLKGAALEQCHPGVFEDSVAATVAAFDGRNRPSKSLWAYLQGAISGKLRDLGLVPAAELKAITVPAELLEVKNGQR